MITIFVIIVFAISYFGLEKLKNSTRENIRNTLQTILHSNQETIYIWIAQRKIDVATLAKDRKIVNLTSKLINQRRSHIKSLYLSTLGKIKNYLAPELEKNKDMEFYILSNDGVTIASNVDGHVGKINFIYQYKKKIFNNVYKGMTEFVNINHDIKKISHPYVFDIKRMNGYFIVSPMQDILGKVVAVLAIRINPRDEFSRITSLGRLSNSGETYAFNKEGLLITESRLISHIKNIEPVIVNKEGQNLIKIVDPGVNLLKTKRIPATNVDMPLTFMAQSAVKGEAGFNMSGYRDYRGVMVMGVWLWDNRLGLGLATEIDLTEGMQSYIEIRNTLIAIISIAVMFFILLFVFMQILQRESKKKLNQAYLELEERVVIRTKELEDAKLELTKANKELEVLSFTDGLTGISNRRNFDHHLENEWRHCLREKISITIIMIDIDHFKRYNDKYGHLKGDDCIKSIAHMLKKSGIADRPGDLVARYGGEEFVVILIGASVEYSVLIANKIRDNVANLKIPHETTEIKNYKIVSVSVGYARGEDVKNISPSDLIMKADEALYKAKNNGRNQVCGYPDLSSSHMSDI